MYPAYCVYFGLGVCAYWIFRKDVIQDRLAYIAVAVFSIAILFCNLHVSSYLYIMIAASTPTLFNLTKRNKFDNYIGDLSYPLYILHMPLYSLLTKVSVFSESKILLLLTIIAVSAATTTLIERPINSIRQAFARGRLESRSVSLVRSASVDDSAKAA
jgi:peptidoglycan/LPS O-acetylase OafA/YrhL